MADAVACVYDAGNDLLQLDGTDAEGLLLLESGPAIWGEEWYGLGKAPSGFSFTSLNGGTNGTFTLSAALGLQYDQFAIGIKDGGDPRWAIFLLAEGDLSSSWAFINGGGNLSHWAIYGHRVGDRIPDDPPVTVPDGGATVAMLGMSMVGLGYARRKFSI